MLKYCILFFLFYANPLSKHFAISLPPDSLSSPQISNPDFFIFGLDTFNLKVLPNNSDFDELPVGVGSDMILYAKGAIRKTGLKILSYAINLENRNKTSRIALNVGVSKVLPLNIYPALYLTLNDSNQFQPIYYPENRNHLRCVYKIPDNSELLIAPSALNNNELKFNNMNYNVIHAVASNSNSVIIFSSNMPGGYGGYDLYISRKFDSIFTTPENLGPFINSKFDELHPFLVNDTRFFYSTNGPSANHNFDIYTSSFHNYMINKAEPLYNLNTDYNEIAFVADSKMKWGAFASDRPNKNFGLNIYNFFPSRNELNKRYQKLNNDLSYKNIESAKCVKLDASASIDKEGAKYDYHWDFGDGSSAEGIISHHCFTKKGRYIAVLSATATDIPGVTKEKVLEVPIEIFNPLEIKIQSLDTCSLKTTCEFIVNKNWDNHQAQLISATWKTDEHNYYSGSMASINFTIAGWHKVELILELEVQGKRVVTHSSRKIFILN